MPQTLTFRTKLLCTLAVPLVALLALTAVAWRATNDAAGGDLVGAQSTLRGVLPIAVGALLLSAAITLVLARGITRRLRNLTEAAGVLAHDQLPKLVDGLRAPDAEDARYLQAAAPTIEVKGDDEIAQLAAAFNGVQQMAIEVAAEQADLLRKGIGDIFVSLSRRNQLLIDRQIELLDELEAAERDPDQLGSLFRIDHLATRMRRNAESLLVLAGQDSSRRRTRPVPLLDVVRAAIGETEQYARIEIRGFDETDVLGTAAVDLGHLLAELFENATQYSPPDTTVTIDGCLAPKGYVVSISDAGLGMTADQIDQVNALLTAPPALGLSLGRSLGFTVVARLAARHGVTVRLEPGSTGLSAVVSLPASVVAVGAGGHVTDEPSLDSILAQELEPDAAPALHVVDAVAPSTIDDGPVFGADDDVFEAAFRRAWGDDDPEADPRAAAFMAEGLDFDLEATLAAAPPPVEPVLEGFDDDELVRPAAAPAGDEWTADDDGWQEREPIWKDTRSVPPAPAAEPAAGPSVPVEPATEEQPAAEVAPEPAAWPAWEPEAAALDPEPQIARPAEPAAEPEPLAPLLADALPTGSAFDRGLDELLRPDLPPAPPTLVEPPVVTRPLPAEPAAMPVADLPAVDLPAVDLPAVDLPPVVAPVAEPEPGEASRAPRHMARDDVTSLFAGTSAPASAPPDGGQTSSGLARRVPAGVVEELPARPAGPAIAANKRSPEDVRAMLAKYKFGKYAAQGGTDEERSDG